VEIPLNLLNILDTDRKISRLENLDLLRGIASLGVLYGHSVWILGSDNLYFPFVSIQDYCVVLFLALSGFVIGYNYKPYQFRAKTFVSRRFTRIYPTLVACLIFTYILDCIRFKLPFLDDQFNESFNIINFASSLLIFDHYFLLEWLNLNHYLVSFFSEFGSNRVLWTLSLEWAIYMLYASIFSKEIGWKLFILILPFSLIGILSFFHSRIPFMIICWILGLLISQNKIKSPFIILYSGLIISLLNFQTDAELFLLTSPIILYIFITIRIPYFLSFSGKLLGNISYPLYLCHYPIMMIITPLIIQFGKIITFTTVIFSSIFVSFLIYLIVDNNRNKIISFFRIHSDAFSCDKKLSK